MNKKGFTLIEVMISIAIVSLAFMVVYGTIANTLTQSTRIIGETKGATLTQQIMVDLGVAVKQHLTQTPIYKIPLPSTISSSALTSSVGYYYFDNNGSFLGSGQNPPSNATYRVGVGSNMVSQSPNNVYEVLVEVYWPAQADPKLGYPNEVSVVSELNDQ